MRASFSTGRGSKEDGKGEATDEGKEGYHGAGMLDGYRLLVNRLRLENSSGLRLGRRRRRRRRRRRTLKEKKKTKLMTYVYKSGMPLIKLFLGDGHWPGF